MLATHVIWTTYMTWPPGDERGHWSPLFDLYGRLIEEGHKLNLPHPTSLKRALQTAKEDPRILNLMDQQIVADTIGDVLKTQMESSAQIFAGAVEHNHVHLLLGRLEESIDRVVGRLKGRTSSEVIRLGSEPERERTWTAGFWKVFLFDLPAVPVVVRYIEEHNERRGMPSAPYPWITRWR